MTAEEFRDLALELPEAIESSHMNHPDFRVGGKIFATLWPDEDWGMVKLTREEQAMFVRSHSGMFQPVKGGWGQRGATRVILSAAKKNRVREALQLAWRNTAPKRLILQLDDS